MTDAEASCSPQNVGDSLTEQLEKCLRDAAEIGVAEVSARYKEDLTKQVALLHLENQELREENQRLKQRLGAGGGA